MKAHNWFIVMFCCVAPLRGQAVLDRLDDLTRFDSEALGLHADLSFMADATLFAAEQPAQGLLSTDDRVFFAPRLMTVLDEQPGVGITLHSQMRLERGFYSGAACGGQVGLAVAHAEDRC